MSPQSFKGCFAPPVFLLPLVPVKNLWGRWHRFLWAGRHSCNPANSDNSTVSDRWLQPWKITLRPHPFLAHHRTPARVYLNQFLRAYPHRYDGGLNLPHLDPLCVSIVPPRHTMTKNSNPNISQPLNCFNWDAVSRSSSFSWPRPLLSSFLPLKLSEIAILVHSEPQKRRRSSKITATYDRVDYWKWLGDATQFQEGPDPILR